MVEGEIMRKFKAGDKVRCTRRRGFFRLFKDKKIYTVEGYNKRGYLMISGEKYLDYEHHFILEQQLKVAK